MLPALRLGSFELRRAASADRSAKRRSVASSADALALLKQLRLDPALARRLVHAAGGTPPTSRAGDDALRALALLLWRGTYVLLDPGPAFRVPLLEMPSEEEGFEEPPPEVAEEESDGHPPAIVPPEYPRVAAYITSGLYAALKAAEQRLEEQLFRGLAPMPPDQLPTEYREVGQRGHRELAAATHHAVLALDRMVHQEGALGSPTDTAPSVYRELADSNGAQAHQSILTIASSLERLFFRGDTELSMAEGTLHTNALPPVLRETTDVKVRTVRDSTEGAASRLDSLLYVGFDE